MPTGDFPDPEGMVWTDAAGWVPASSPVWQREVSDAVTRLAAIPPPTPDPRDAEIERLRAAHQDIIRKYEKVMGEPPYWTNFKSDQLAWVREAWYGAAKISRKALCNDEQNVTGER